MPCSDSDRWSNAGIQECVNKPGEGKKCSQGRDETSSVMQPLKKLFLSIACTTAGNAQSTEKLGWKVELSSVVCCQTMKLIPEEAGSGCLLVNIVIIVHLLLSTGIIWAVLEDKAGRDYKQLRGQI